ncbi:hypothetical protein ACOSP7_007037 [Xanthoceras sorbifolium]
MRQTPLEFIIPDNVPTTSPQSPSVTLQTEMSTQDVDQAGYHFQTFMEIMSSIITPLGENRGGNTGPNKETTSHKRCASKWKESLPLPEPFSSESSSQSTGSSQTERSPACGKKKHRRGDSQKPSSETRWMITRQARRRRASSSETDQNQTDSE